MNKEEINQILEVNCCDYHIKIAEKAHKYINELQTRIDKAIEYIKEHNIVGMNKEYLPRGYECCYSGELMEILKGEDNE